MSTGPRQLRLGQLHLGTPVGNEKDPNLFEKLPQGAHEEAQSRMPTGVPGDRLFRLLGGDGRHRRRGIGVVIGINHPPGKTWNPPNAFMDPGRTTNRDSGERLPFLQDEPSRLWRQDGPRLRGLGCRALEKMTGGR